MAEIDVECCDSFPIGGRVTQKGQHLKMERARAIELSDAGFVRILPDPRNKMRPDSLQAIRPGKAPAAGTDAPSSSSPAAPASRPTMRNKSEPGARGPRGTK